MAEQHYKETKAAKLAQQHVDEHDSGYRFDLARCRKMFNEYDRDGSGYLDVGEIANLAEVDWKPISCRSLLLTLANPIETLLNALLLALLRWAVPVLHFGIRML